MLSGRVWKYGDHVNTDLIIPGRYLDDYSAASLAAHAMEDIDPLFSTSVIMGDMIVAGRNFGCGSSREQAPLALKAAGVGAVVAGSFARIFYRNCINVGLPVVEVDTSNIAEGDVLQIDIESGVVKNLTKGVTLEAKPLPPVMMKILADGGLAEHIKKNGGFALEGDEPSE